MKPVRAQFVQHSRPGRLLWGLAAAMLMAAAATGVIAWRQHVELEHSQQEAARATREVEQAAAAARQPKPFKPPPYDASAREMLRERSLPWPQVLTALETVTMVGVTPSSVEMLLGESAMRVEVSFSDHAKLLEYLAALNAGVPEGGPAWRWSLTQAQMTGPGVGVAVLVAHWGAGAPR